MKDFVYKNVHRETYEITFLRNFYARVSDLDENIMKVYN